jgi:hypothetical protein
MLAVVSPLVIAMIGLWLVLPTFRKDHERPLPRAKIHDGSAVVPHESAPHQFVAGAVLLLGGLGIAVHAAAFVR